MTCARFAAGLFSISCQKVLQLAIVASRRHQAVFHHCIGLLNGLRITAHETCALASWHYHYAMQEFQLHFGKQTVMKFKHYAFREHVKMIDDYPGSQVGVLIGFTRDDLFILAHMTPDELTKRPASGRHGQNISAGTVARCVPHGSACIEDKLETPILAGAATMLPAAFATLGYAAKTGREVEMLVARQLSPSEIDSFTAQKGTLKPETFAGYERDILQGAKSFFAQLYSDLEEPDQIVMYAFVKPLMLS